MEGVKQVKLLISSLFSAVFMAIGWIGVLIILFVIASFLDYYTGSRVARINGMWTSNAAREGRHRKYGTFIAIAAAGILDLVIMILINNFTMIQLPFSYPPIFFVLSLVWYTFTELGSIIENVGRGGTRVPEFLSKGIKVLKGKVETTADDIVGNENE